jgi:radical SAM protein with 4Fe4S-binding SPASM domain
MHKVMDGSVKSCFDIIAPWLLGEKPEFTLRITDNRLIGSGEHFIRFDMYPVYAPSHLKRHHGFWDLPLKYIKHERTTLTLEHGELLVRDGWRPVRIKPVWKGDIPFRGYSRLHVSLWDSSRTPPEQKIVKSFPHVILPDDGDLALEQVYLPVTQFCNLGCVMCRRRARSDLYGGNIPSEVLEPVLDTSQDLRNVHAQEIGEPLLNENIYAILTRLKQRMPALSTVGTCTNATLLNREKVRRLLDTGIDYLYFSVDGATKMTLETIRPGSDFNEIIHNISSCAEYRSVTGRKKPWLMMNFIIMENNYHEMPAYARLAGSLGVDSVRYNHFIDFSSGECRTLSEETMAPLLAEAVSEADKYGLKLVLPRYRRIENSGCKFMQSAIVLISGDVIPCARMRPYTSPLPLRTFGNIKKHSLMEIWNRTDYKEFRHRILTGDFLEECLTCDYKSGLMAGS